MIDPGDDLDDAIITTMSRDGIRRDQAAGAVKERPVAARAYTVAEAGYESGRRTGHRDVFRIGSVSKTFTALAIMRLVQDGAIDNLDSPRETRHGLGRALAPCCAPTLVDAREQHAQRATQRIWTT